MKITYWLPRVIALLFLAFLVLFSFDVFGMEGTLFQKTGGFLVHNIPVIIFALLLVFAWKEEKKGGYLFIVLGIAFTFFFKTYQRIDTFLLISFPVILVGILFILNKQNK